MANELKSETKAQVVSLLCEGNSIRSIERISGIHRDTIMRLGVRVGNRKARVGRNPATGETIQIKPKRVVKFRVAKAAKDAILGVKK